MNNVASAAFEQTGIGSELERRVSSGVKRIGALAEKRDDGTFLVRAGDGSHNEHYSKAAWFRDNARVAYSLGILGSKLSDSLWKGIFRALERHEKTMDGIIADPSQRCNDYCVPPRVDIATLESVEGEFSNLQEPQWMGEILHLGSSWIRKAVSGRRAGWDDYVRIYGKLASYLAATDPFNSPSANAWEDWIDHYTSTMASALAGLKTASGIVPVPPDLVAHGERVLAERMRHPMETESRKADVAMLWLGYPYGVASPGQVVGIFGTVWDELMSKDGVQRIKGPIRYRGDSYQGLNVMQGASMHPETASESEWGLGAVALANNLKYMGEHAREIFERPDDVFGMLAERALGFGGAEQYVPLWANGHRQYSEGNLKFEPRNETLAWQVAEEIAMLRR